MKRNAMAAAPALLPVMKAPLEWSMGRQNCYETITAMVWETVSRHVRQEPSLSLKEKLRNIMSRQSLPQKPQKIREPRTIPAAPASSCIAFSVHPAQQHLQRHPRKPLPRIPLPPSFEAFEEFVAAPYMSQMTSQLGQWPCQIKLVPVNAPYFQGAKLLIAADCTAFAYANLHNDFMKGKITLIGCPKLDSVDYSEKLTEIIKNNDIQSVTIVRMEVPCCGGLENAAKKALQDSGKFIPWQVVTISVDGKILD